jgi:hypothetical protein
VGLAVQLKENKLEGREVRIERCSKPGENVKVSKKLVTPREAATTRVGTI